MAIRRLGSLGTLGVLIGALVLISHPAAAQDHAAAPPLVITAFGDKAAPRYSTPPLVVGRARPAGRLVERRHRRHSDAAAREVRQSAVSHRAGVCGARQASRARRRAGGEGAVSSFRSDFARRAFAQTSLIVDPADGRTPAYTPEGTKRPMPRGTYGNGPLDSVNDFSLYERCITRGIAGSMLRVVYGNGTAHRAGAGRRRALLRDGARHAPHLYRRPAAHQPSDPPVPG